jgi:uncharacterized membrane protein (UPF0127 family)
MERRFYKFKTTPLLMKKIFLFLSLVGLILLLVAVSAVFVAYFNNSPSMEKAKICFDENEEKKTCFNVELAGTDLEKTKGLMFREKLENDSGMLFIYEDEADRGFWMKNTLIPLDIIGLDENFSISFIKENVLPCETDSCEVFIIKDSMYVLEINSGVAEKFNLSIGQEAKINF